MKPGEEIGEETHSLDQFIRLEKGRGRVIMDGAEKEIKEDYAVVIPAGAKHNIINDGEKEMKLYTIYSPPEHKDGVIHKTKEEALADTADHFDGKTTE